MKKIMCGVLTVAAMLVAPAFVSAQDGDAQKVAQEAAEALTQVKKDEPQPEAKKVKKRNPNWTENLKASAQFGNSYFGKWNGGGLNNYSFKTFLNGNVNYKKGATYWNNNIQLDYGFLYSEDKPFIYKSDDRIYLQSTFGRTAPKIKNFSYTASFNFRSQFTNTYKYVSPGEDATRQDWMDKRTLKSGFLSPANTNIALGVNWKPGKWITVNAAPLTGGFVIATDELLRARNGMARKAAFEDLQAYPKKDELGAWYKAARFEFGAQIKIDAKVVINNNFTWTSQLVTFSNYLDHPENMRINFDNHFSWRMAKYFTFEIHTFMVYDDKVYIEGSRLLQFKESATFGFSYTFQPKK